LLEGLQCCDVPLETLQDPQFVWSRCWRARNAGAQPHLFDEVMDVGAASHVRFNIFPGCA